MEITEGTGSYFGSCPALVVGTDADVWRSARDKQNRFYSLNTMANKGQALVLEPAGELRFKGMLL